MTPDAATLDAATLDLTRDDFDNATGKILAVNGVPYTIEDIVGRGDTTTVYRIRNQRTNAATFALKVYRVKAGTPAYDRLKRRGLETFHTNALLAQANSQGPGVTKMLTVEIYEQNGGLFGLQRCMTGDAGFQAEAEFKSAMAFLSAGRLSEAIAGFDRVIASHPNHLMALANKAVCCWRAGDPSRALQCALAGVELEPNESTNYLNGAMFLAHSGRPEAAIQVLKRAVHHCRADYDTWVSLLQTATTFDLLDQVEDLVAAGMTLVGDAAVGEVFRDWIANSRRRASRYAKLLQSAVDAQSGREWSDAIRHLDEAIKTSKRRTITQLNRCICLFHLGRFEESMKGLSPLFPALHGDTADGAAALMLAVSAELRHWDTVRKIALTFEGRFAQPVQLPRLPVVATYDYCLEDLSVDRIVSALTAVPSHVECSDTETAAFRALAYKYEVLGATKLPKLPQA